MRVSRLEHPAARPSRGLQHCKYRATLPPRHTRLHGPSPARLSQIHFLILVSRQGKVRLTKWYDTYPSSERTRVVREVSTLVLNRPPRYSNFIEWKERKIVYKRCVPPFGGPWRARRPRPDRHCCRACFPAL